MPGALKIMGFISSLKKKYGKIFTFYMFTRPYIVVCDPQVVRRILIDPLTFPKGGKKVKVITCIVSILSLDY